LQLGRGLFAFAIGAVTRKYLYGNWKASHFKTVLSFAVFMGLHLLLIFWDSKVIFAAPFVFAFLILNASRFDITSDKFVQISDFFGRYSYGFYAWHFPLLLLNSIVFKRILSRTPLIEGWTIHIAFLATIAMSLMMTYLVVRFIEPKVRQLFLPHQS
jgi:peptidoglycan/LPS O-acetylase OafA/YrhL